MILTEKRIRRARNLFITMLIICITPIFESIRPLSGADSKNNWFAGKELVCAIDLGDDMRGAHGLETGFSYELIRQFAKDNNCNVKIVAAGRKDAATYMDSLQNGNIDILITHIEDAHTGDSLNISHAINDCSTWITAGSDLNSVRTINRWISYYTSTPEYNQLEDRFFLHRTVNPEKRAANGVLTKTISPYDDLLKKYAKELGWDWRMLAAVVYQESKFSINSQSHRGATGLMQVKPATGRKYGIDDLVNPENNLIAGTSHLKRLQKMFEGKGFSEEEIIRFTLAAYNAGEGRIMDCRNLAAAQGLDNQVWANIVKIIPLMREDSILEDGAVKLGKFQGYETIAYVENIQSLYNAICKICPAS
jgi:membrane-bound lytic murein transglycosylase MltF